MNNKKIIKIISQAIFCVSLLIVIVLAIAVLPIPGNIKIFTVMSGSMEPAVKTGGVVIVKPVSEYKTGDIVSFASGPDKKITVTHRIIDIRQSAIGREYIVKGDANQDPDSIPVKNEMIVGKVIMGIPLLGFILAWLKNPVIFTLLVIILAGSVIGGEIKKITAHSAGSKQKPA